MSHSPRLVVSVIGAGEPPPAIAALAEEVGAELARRGVVVACGGLGGVMEAACRGAKSQGGATIGILPGSDVNDANPWVDIALPTGLGHARNIIVARAGRAVIAVGGAYGTLTEIAHALVEGIPVVGLDTWKLERDGNTSVIVASDAVDAVEKALMAADAVGACSESNLRGDS